MFADVDADDAAFLSVFDAGLLEVFHALINADIVKAHVVHNAFGGNDAPKTRLRIAGLSGRCKRTHFNMTETQCADACDVRGLLIHAGAKTHGVRKFQTHHLNRIIDFGTGDEFGYAKRHGPINVAHDEAVSGFRIHFEEAGSRHFVKHSYSFYLGSFQ